ncbi:MAG: bifunctional riboflavin kinase/FAD synthetase [Flavobacteriaceae bacterium]|nr:bifunctional riboflavin kinase/FAD synthetase [Bacteroidia bacterium]MBT8288661.1 bifunctional riboflavin kinase/FAD synthetase [Bacteroidia bacterium]NNF74407.1 bifunctional riboflavin kinase/FAD synthetase [Flavobacteriaceae bacterium]
MKITSALESAFESGTVVTIGTFDGVHIGHKKIIERLVAKAKEEQLQSVVLTFFPHPRMVLHQDSQIKLLNTIEEKSQRLEALGLDHLVIKKFTPEFSRSTALEFVEDLLVNKLKTKHLIIGYDHRFGRNRAANIDDLREFGKNFDFEVIEISAQEINEVAVSSTKIRHALQEGNVKMANRYLGHPYMLSGRVVHGQGLGKELKFPTANLQIAENYKLIPKPGVYVVRSQIDGKRVYGMMNIGTKPTVNVDGDQYIEIHLFDFNRDIYGEDLRIEVLNWIRSEQKFESVEALKLQLKKDRKMARSYIKKHHD